MICPGFLSSAERLALEACVRRQREDHGIARRAKAILPLDDGKSCVRITKFFYLDDDIMRGCYKTFVQVGWDALALDGWKGGQSRMTPAQEAGGCPWLEERFCRSKVEITAHGAAVFGLDYSNSGCIKLPARLGFEYRKPQPLPRVSSAQKQAAFIALYVRLMNELPTDEAVYFAESVYREDHSKPAFAWVRAGPNPAVLSTAGRGRVCIHGAVSLETFDAPFVEPATVDWVSAVQLLAKIEARNPENRTIHVIWDNAAYHKRRDVRFCLARTACRIHLIQLPLYCPHLNPIARLWAVLHQYVTHNRSYPNQKQFADAILAFMRVTIPKEWQKFRGKLSDNFRVVTHEKFRVLG